MFWSLVNSLVTRDAKMAANTTKRSFSSREVLENLFDSDSDG
jgi:hypothetical protein